MSSVNGQALIPIFRGRQSTHFVATTKELLSTGVNVPCVRNIVFFRYLQSPILSIRWWAAARASTPARAN
jgi:type I site-specific restriction endonuclease